MGGTGTDARARRLALAAIALGAAALVCALVLLPGAARVEALVGATVAAALSLAATLVATGATRPGVEGPRETGTEQGTRQPSEDVAGADGEAGTEAAGATAALPDADDATDSGQAGAATQPGPLARPSELVDALAQDGDPLGTLRGLVAAAQAREDAPEPEATFARWLAEAGLGEGSGPEEVEAPRTRVVRLRRTELAYLRIEEPQVTYLARRKVLAVEAALNRMLLVEALAGEGLPQAGPGELYRHAQGLADSICAQAAPLGWAIGRRGGREGEWAVRSIIATQIEGWRLPYRLEATFRCSVLNGEVAFEVTLPDPECFPRTRWSRELGRVIPTSSHMRSRAATAYALRLGLLLAAGAFEASGNVRRVHVAGIRETARHRSCLFSASFGADRFRMLVDLAHVSDPAGCYRALGARISLDAGVLRPVEQGFSLEEERFCPRRRQLAPELSDRILPSAEGRALGAVRARDLASDEGARLHELADELVRNLGTSCEQDVRALMDLARREGSGAVAEAARRTAGRLIDGTVGETPDEVVEEFVGGDELSRGVREAFLDLAGSRAGEAVSRLADLLAPLEVDGTYEDAGGVAWRSFRSHAERALYNRLEADDAERCRLVPGAYYDAHLVLASALLERGDAEAALQEARRLTGMAPLDERGRLRAVRALELMGDVEGAAHELAELLERAYTPEAVAVGYYRLAFMCWQSGDVEGADACYRRSLRFPSEMALAAAGELLFLDATNPALAVAGTPTDEEVDRRLTERGIPLAPVDRVTQTLLECTAAAVEVEVFPVARSLAQALARLSGDDVAFALADSLEGEPDE